MVKKWKVKEKKLQIDDSYLLLFVYTLSTTITIKKIKYLHYIHSVSTFITVRYAYSNYICCCRLYLRVLPNKLSFFNKLI